MALDNIDFCPVFAGDLGCAIQVEEKLKTRDYDLLVCDLARHWHKPLSQLVQELPIISVLNQPQSQSSPSINFIVTPTDPYCVGLKLAESRNIPCRFIGSSPSHSYYENLWSTDLASLTAGNTWNKLVKFQNELQGDATPIDDYALYRLSELYDNILYIGHAGSLNGLKQSIVDLAGDEEQTQKDAAPSLEKEGGLTLVKSGEPTETAKDEAHELHQIEPKRYRLSTESIQKLLPVAPYLTKMFWQCLDSPERFDAMAEFQSALLIGRNTFEEKYSDTLPLRTVGSVWHYIKRWLRIKGNLFPSVFEIVTSCNNFVDNSFAFEVWTVLTEYPHYDPVGRYPEINLDFKDLGLTSKKMRIAPRTETSEHGGPLRLLPKRRDYTKNKFDEEPFGGMCSYPPEDILIEDYSLYLQRYSIQIMQSQKERTHPFSSSLLDGLDYRQTIRNMTVDGQIYVKEKNNKGGESGSVVVIFDDEDDITSAVYGQKPTKYEFTATWWGEHDEESDMAFYASAERENIGPGISRLQYGGLLLSYPPRRMPDVWEMWHDFAFRSKAERLLLAAIAYNEKQNVVYVSTKQPAARMVNYARRVGQKVIYIPITSLNPVMLRRIRNFHILDSHSRREGAHEYIT